MCIALNKDRRRDFECADVDLYERNRSSGGNRASRTGRERDVTGGEAASAGLTPQGTGCRSPFAHLTVWTSTWMLAGAAVTTTLSWVYATTSWAVKVTAGGNEIIEEAAEVTKHLVFRASEVGDRAMSAYAKFIERMIDQTGDAATVLLVIATAVIAKTFVYESWHWCERRRERCVLPWWRTPAEPVTTEVAAATQDVAR